MGVRWGLTSKSGPRCESFDMLQCQIPTLPREGGGVGTFIDRCSSSRSSSIVIISHFLNFTIIVTPPTNSLCASLCSGNMWAMLFCKNCLSCFNMCIMIG